MIDKFYEYLKKKGLSRNTMTVYKRTVSMYFDLHKEISQTNLFSFKGYLIENFKPKTVNLRIQAINKFLTFINKEELRLSSVKIQQKPFLENVISNADYVFLKNKLKNEKKMDWYFVVRFLATTGSRVSELIQIKVEHVKSGYLDLYSKGGKMRRIYFPFKLQQEALIWLDEKKVTTGYIFLNNKKARISTRGIALGLKKLAIEYGLDPNVVYPHSFRHRFAKNFIEKYNDIAFLADLMGHDSIETTRIYLRKSSTEQKQIVDKVIVW